MVEVAWTLLHTSLIKTANVISSLSNLHSSDHAVSTSVTLRLAPPFTPRHLAILENGPRGKSTEPRPWLPPGASTHGSAASRATPRRAPRRIRPVPQAVPLIGAVGGGFRPAGMYVV